MDTMNKRIIFYYYMSDVRLPVLLVTQTAWIVWGQFQLQNLHAVSYRQNLYDFSISTE